MNEYLLSFDPADDDDERDWYAEYDHYINEREREHLESLDYGSDDDHSFDGWFDELLDAQEMRAEERDYLIYGGDEF